MKLLVFSLCIRSFSAINDAFSEGSQNPWGSFYDPFPESRQIDWNSFSGNFPWGSMSSVSNFPFVPSFPGFDSSFQTQAPTTEPPTTEPLTTIPPTTQSPKTQAPAGADGVIGFSFMFDTAIVGFDLYVYDNVLNITSCTQRCLWDDRCSAVTFVSEGSELCFLKTGDVIWEEELSPQEGAISAYIAQLSVRPPTLPPMCARNEFRIFLDRDVVGFTLLSLQTSSIKACEEGCAGTTGCTAYTATAPQGEEEFFTCEYKTGAVTEEALSPSPGRATGLPCPEMAQPERGCLSVGFTPIPEAAIPGRDLFSTESVNVDECLLVCTEVRSCTGFTFTENNCDLKSGEEPFPLVARDDAFSGHLCRIQSFF